MKTKRDRLSVLTRNAAFILVGGVLSTQAGCYQTVSPRPARTVTVVQAPWPAATTAVAAPVAAIAPPAGPRLATFYRYADQYDEYFVRGDAALSGSPVFSNGIRLAAWDAQAPNEVSRVAVASAVYLFSIPPGASTLRLDIGYRRAEMAGDQAVAGLVYVRNLAVEERYRPDVEPDGEPGFYGDSYVLLGNDTRTVFDIATADRVIDGVLELHLSAGAGQAFDVNYVQVTALADPVVVVPLVTTQVLPSPCLYTYRYYYVGPWQHCYADRVVAYTFHVDDVDPFFWGGWVTHRAFFFTHHPWVYRPAVYAHPGHFRPRDDHGRFAQGTSHLASYRQGWYQSHFRVDVARMTERDLDTRVRTHRDVRPENDRLRHEQEQRRITETVRVSQERLRQAEGNRYQNRVAAWSKDPRQARQDLRTFGDRDPDVRTARESWQTQRSRRPDAGTSGPRPDAIPARPQTGDAVRPADARPVRPSEPEAGPKHEAQDRPEQGSAAPKPHDDRRPSPQPAVPGSAGNSSGSVGSAPATAPVPPPATATVEPRPGATPKTDHRPHREETAPARPAPAPTAADGKQRPGSERPAGSPNRVPERARPVAAPSQPAPVVPVQIPAPPPQPAGIQPPAPATPATRVVPRPSERRSPAPERNGHDRVTDKPASAPVPVSRPAERQPTDAGGASRRTPERQAPTPAAPAARPAPAPTPAAAAQPEAAPAEATPQPAATGTTAPDSENDKRNRKEKDENDRRRGGRH